MSFRVMVHLDAKKFLDTLPGDRRAKIAEALRGLQSDPSGKRATVDIRKLKGSQGRKDVYRLRVGDYRVLYDIDGNTIWVTEIFHRGRGYR